MKRFISIAMVFMMLFALAACQNAGGNNADPTAAPTQNGTGNNTAKVTPEPEATEPTDPIDDPVPEPTEMPERPGDDPNAPRVFAGKDVFFILYPDGSLYGWGNNEYGQLGIGAETNVEKPVYVAQGLTPVVVGDTVLALGSSGTLWGWGRNDKCQLGILDAENKSRPVELMDLVKDVEVCSDCCYIITESGAVYFWGFAGVPNVEDGVYTPTKIFENVEYFTPYCMIKDGGELWLKRGDWMKIADGAVRVFEKRDIVSFVEREDGMLYYINDQNGLEPVCGNVRDVQISNRCAYILQNDGSLLSYEYGGNRVDLVMDHVVEIKCDWETDEDWGYNYNFALKLNGELWAWSASYSNEIVGKAAENESPEPSRVAEDVKEFFTNNAQTFIIKNDGSVWATGLNSDGDEGFFFGSLGDGSEKIKYGFTELEIKNVVKIFTVLNAEYYDNDDGTDGVKLYARTFAVDDEGRVWAWGYNGDGLLGVDSEDEDVTKPMEVFVTKD